VIGPFPWYYSRERHEDYEPVWNEEKHDWNEWRLRIPPEWRHQPLTDAPDSLKRRLGLLHFPETNGDPSCPVCKACEVYHVCKENHMHDQANCTSHQLWCNDSHIVGDIVQLTLEAER
jgi:hypothetical protein